MKRNFLGFFVFITVFFLSGALFGSFAFAEDDIEDKKDDLEDLREKQENYQKIVDLKENQEQALRLQIDSLSQQTERLEQNINQNERKLSETEKKIAILVLQITEKEKTIIEQKEFLAEFVRSYYDWNSADIRNVLFSSSDEGNVFAPSDSSLQFQDGISDIVEKIEGVRRSLERDKESLGRERSEIETLNTKLEQQSVYLESSKQKKEQLAVKTGEEKKQYEKKLSKIEEEIRDIEQEIEAMESEKSNGLDLSTLPSRSDAAMQYPLEKGEVTQGYGKTTFTRWYTFHNGIDFGVSSGTNVLAAAKGKVKATGDSGKYAYGKWIAIDHGNGLVTLYGHLSKHRVKTGDSVKRGDVIGLSGNTGYSTGPHLHFSVFADSSFEIVNSTKVSGVKIPTGAHVNPMRYL